MTGLAVGLIASELAVRYLSPPGKTRGGHQMTFSAGTLESFMADDECGYLPKPDSIEYNRFGCMHNDYDGAIKPPHKKRILFAGDSVTHRGRLIAALRQLYGEEDYEYWNAGVESFNTRQELVLYRRYNSTISPDQVILTFHNNDFMLTPLVFAENGNLRILTPTAQRETIHPWWFENSTFYRYLLGRRGSQYQPQEVRQSLAEFRDLTASQGVDFRVIVLPIFKPVAQWDKNEMWSRQQTLAILQELKIPHYDMLGVLERLLEQGSEVQEQPGDNWHPNDEACRAFANDLKYRELLLPARD